MSTQPLAYPTVEGILNLARVMLNDAFAGATNTPGEGRVFTDTSPFALPCLNAAILALGADLENANVPATRTEEVILAIPPINSTATGGGVGEPDASLQQILSFAGFFDGSDQTTTPALPNTLVVPNEIGERENGTNAPFAHVTQADGQLISRLQGPGIGMWEWRSNSIVWNGSTYTEDIRLRYTVGLAPVTAAPADFPTTYVPLLASQNALAALTAYQFSVSQTMAQAAADLRQSYVLELDRLIQRQVRISQATPPRREPFGRSGDIFGWFG